MTIAQILSKMIAASNGNIHDIDHLLRVWAYARTIGELEGLGAETQYLLEVAAITHDIACPLCREKYGNTNGEYQEQEGAVLVRAFLADTGMTEAQSAAISPFLKVVPVEVRHADTPYIFDIQVTVFHGPDSAQVRLVGHHTNVVSVRRGGQVLLEREISEGSGSLTDRSCLTVEGIVAFADCLSTEDVEEVLEQQIRCNMAIAEEGLRHDYGANIGKTLLRGHEEDLSYRMRAYAAAASDARMNGCEMPVVINSGSGNQGITSSVPVIVCVPRAAVMRSCCGRWRWRIW